MYGRFHIFLLENLWEVYCEIARSLPGNPWKFTGKS